MHRTENGAGRAAKQGWAWRAGCRGGGKLRSRMRMRTSKSGSGQLWTMQACSSPSFYCCCSSSRNFTNLINFLYLFHTHTVTHTLIVTHTVTHTHSNTLTPSQGSFWQAAQLDLSMIWMAPAPTITSTPLSSLFIHTAVYVWVYVCVRVSVCVACINGRI